MSLIFILLLTLNVSTFLLYGWDKRQAKNKQWRTSENALLMVAFLGGSLGAVLGMLFFRHKTSKPSFLVKIGLILLFQVALGYYFYSIQI